MNAVPPKLAESGLQPSKRQRAYAPVEAMRSFIATLTMKLSESGIAYPMIVGSEKTADSQFKSCGKPVPE
jgi:hypothetical protein